jgi:hypothetical protein
MASRMNITCDAIGNNMAASLNTQSGSHRISLIYHDFMQVEREIHSGIIVNIRLHFSLK